MRYKDLLNTNDILHLLTAKLNFAPKQMGKSIFLLCPFHGDKNPSLSFEPSRKIFTCFSCGFKASDIFDFWAKYKKISLEESVIEISKLGYFSLANWQEQKNQEQKGKNKIFFLNSLATDIYRHNLFTEPGQEILDYLQKRRRLNRLMITRFSLGCTISNKQLTNLLFQQKNENFSSTDLLSTNLVLITSDNRTVDFFAEKQLIIPLMNEENRIIAFASRKIEESEVNEGKYKYLPSHQHYHKSSLLYNYSTAKKSRKEEVYLVEGFFDVISLIKLGIENCVAILGTSLSEDQHKLLADLQKKVVLFLDGDRAGKEASISILIKLLLREIDCEVIRNNYEEDPDEICHQHNAESIQVFLQKRENPYLFILNYYFFKWEVAENPQRISHFVREVAKIFQNFKLNIRDFLIEKLSLLVKWNKGEIETYFIKRNFPFPNLRYLQIVYCQELIREKELIIIQFCIQSRICWAIATKKSYFFFDQCNRRDYWNVCNYYSLNHFSDFFPNKLENDSVSSAKSQNIPEGPNKLIDKIFQKIDQVKKFLLTYEQKYYTQA